MIRPTRPANATHWCNETGFFCRADGGVVNWWWKNPQTGKREWKLTSIPASDLSWNFMYARLQGND